MITDDNTNFELFQAFTEWVNLMEEIMSRESDGIDYTPQLCNSVESISQIIEDCFLSYLNIPGWNAYDVRLRLDGLGGKLIPIISEMDNTFVRVCTLLYNSRNILYKIASFRLMTSVSRLLGNIPPFVYNTLNDPESFNRLVEDAMNTTDYPLADYALALLASGGSIRFITDQLTRTSLPSHVINRMQFANRQLDSNEDNTLVVDIVNQPPNAIVHPYDNGITNNSWNRPHKPTTDGSKYWVFVIANCLAFLKTVADYVEVQGPMVSGGSCAIAVHILNIVIKKQMKVNFLWKYMCILAVGFIGSALAHKRIAIELFDCGGLESLLVLGKSSILSMLHADIAYCFHSISCYDIPMERLLKSEGLAEAIVNLGMDFLKSSDEAIYHHAVLFVTEVVTYLPMLELVNKQQGDYHLLNLLRISLANGEGGEFSKVALNVQKDSLRAIYILIRSRAAVAIDFAKTRSAPNSLRQIPLEDSPKSQLEYLYSQLDSHGSLPPSMLTEAGGKPVWEATAGLIHHRGVPLLLRCITGPQRTSDLMCFALSALTFSCVEVTVVTEVLECRVPQDGDTVATSGSEESHISAMTAVLNCAQGLAMRDPVVMIEALRLLAALITPPIFHLEKSEGNKTFGGDDVGELEVKQRLARSQLRACGGIRSLLNLLNYRRSVQHADTVRLETIQVLLGLSVDADINQLLDKMGLANSLTLLLQNLSQGTTSWPGGNRLLSVLRNKSLLLRSRLGSMMSNSGDQERLTGSHALSLVGGHHAEGMSLDPDTASVSSRLLERESIVAATKIEFPPEELLLLIRDHLLKQGLTVSAAALESEGHLPPPLPRNFPHVAEAHTPSQRRNNAATPAKSTGKRSVTATTVTSAGKDSQQLTGEPNAKRLRFQRSPSLNIGSTSTPRQSTTHTCISTPGTAESKSNHRTSSTINSSAASLYRRGIGGSYKKLTAARKQSLAGPSFLSKPASIRPGTSSAMDKRYKSSQMRPCRGGAVTLHNMATTFLRNQHMMCTHPVAVGPPFSLLAPHRCPIPTPDRCGVTSSLHYRSLEYDPTHLACRSTEALFREFIYQRWRTFRTFRDEEQMLTCSAFDVDCSKIWIGCSDQSGEGGALRLYDLVSFTEVESWEMPAIESIVVSPLEDRPFILTVAVTAEAAIMSPVLTYETSLWKTDTSDRFSSPLFVFPGDDRPSIRKPVFSPSVTRIAGLHGSGSRPLTSVFDIETGSEVRLLDASQGLDMTVYLPAFKRPTVAFGFDGDDILFSDGILWDVRTSSAIHRFDRLTNNGSAAFHPNGHTLLLDSAVWDIRRFGHLIMTVPSLENSQVQFMTSGNTLLGYQPYTLDDIHSGRRVTDDNCNFCVYSSSDFSLIHKHIIEREGTVCWGLQVDYSGLDVVALVEAVLDVGGVQDCVCRILEPGKKRLDDDDSDAEDNASDGEWGDEDDEDDEDDFPEGLEGEEDDFSGEEDENEEGFRYVDVFRNRAFESDDEDEDEDDEEEDEEDDEEDEEDEEGEGDPGPSDVRVISDELDDAGGGDDDVWETESED